MFIGKYAEYIYKAQPANLEPITGERVKETCVDANKTVSGMDGWEPAELALLPDSAFEG